MRAPPAAASLRGYIGLSLVWLAILAAVLFVSRRPSAQPIEIIPPPTLLPTITTAPVATAGPWRVDVAGAVRSPGVYTLPAGSVVADAIAVAGGPVADADLDRINKAAPLAPGTQVYVPRIAETPRAISAPAPPAPATSAVRLSAPVSPTARLVNLNTASIAELDTLPGIGLATAQAIIAGRPYSRVEDLLRVKGIGQATLEKLRDLVTVE
jgi:competence protein ComEA